MALFNEHEIIMYLSENMSEKQLIEDGINRKLITIHHIDQLVETMEESDSRYGKVNIIMTANPSEQLKMYMEETIRLVQAIIDTYDTILVTIGVNTVFSESLDFGRIESFVDYARKHDRHQRISELEESPDENDRHGAVLLKQLLNEQETLQEQYDQTKLELDKQVDRVELLESEVKKMELEIETVYKVEMDNNRTYADKYERQIDDLKRKLLIEQKKMEDYEVEVNDYRNKNKALELDISSFEQYIEELQDRNALANSQIKALKVELDNKDLVSAELLNSHVDKEKYAILQSNYDRMVRERLDLEDAVRSATIENKKKDFRINEIMQENQNLRQGDVDIGSSGRTLRLDTHVFDNVNVFYFKVVKDLPYLSSYISKFIENIETHFGDKTVTCILKHDDGLDSHLFKGLEIYSNLGSVPRGEKLFLLYPSQRMMTNAKDFEVKYNNLIVVDYIQSDQYYIETQSYERIFNVLRYSNQLKQYNLRGLPISLDAESVLDIRHDPSIENATTSIVREKMVQTKVNRMLKNANIVD